MRFTTRGGEPWIIVPKLDTLPEPVNLGRLKDAVHARWGTVDLLDLLKEADLLTGFTEEFTSVASRDVIPASYYAAGWCCSGSAPTWEVSDELCKRWPPGHGRVGGSRSSVGRRAWVRAGLAPAGCVWPKGS